MNEQEIEKLKEQYPGNPMLEIILEEIKFYRKEDGSYKLSKSQQLKIGYNIFKKAKKKGISMSEIVEYSKMIKLD